MCTKLFLTVVIWSVMHINSICAMRRPASSCKDRETMLDEGELSVPLSSKPYENRLDNLKKLKNEHSSESEVVATPPDFMHHHKTIKLANQKAENKRLFKENDLLRKQNRTLQDQIIEKNIKIFELEDQVGLQGMMVKTLQEEIETSKGKTSKSKK